MLYFDRIDVSEGIDVNRISESKECDICHYWYFLDNFQFDICNGCHDVLMMSMNLSSIQLGGISTFWSSWSRYYHVFVPWGRY